MTEKPSPNALAFQAAGLIAFSAWLAPSAQASDVARFYGWVLSGAAGLAGTLLAIQAIRNSEPRPSPWPGSTGRVLWALRPRGWMLAWLAIATAVAIAGLPGLAVEYPPRRCTYAVPFIGFVRPVDPGVCDWVRLFPWST